ncbi:hypothetical protein [Streptomyces sp. NPDC057554]|uniref:hypothetical protein n=1 Tax=Streptomyces sp. NPDC057554 TaxID=3350538 RepID=UPI0036871540
MVRRWVPALVLGGVWWWAVLRLVLQPEQAGAVEGAVAAGGWGLSLLPVHVASLAGAPGPGRGLPEGRAGVEGAERGTALEGAEGRMRSEGFAGAWLRRSGITRAWRRRRSGGGSGRW